MNKKRLIYIISTLMLSTIILYGCGTKEDKVIKSTSSNQGVREGEYNPSIPGEKKTTQNSDKNSTKALDESNKKDDNSSTNTATKAPTTNTNQGIAKGEYNPAIPLNFDMITISPDTTFTFNTPWEKSESGKFTATIDGKGEQAGEEGYADIVVQNIKTKELKKLVLKEAKDKQITPKQLEWIDDNRMYVIIGSAFGTVTKGGKVYEVNVNTGEAILILEPNIKSQEIISIKKETNGFSYEKYVWEDENLTKGHVEKGVWHK